MGGAVHIGIHDMVGILKALETELFTKSLGNGNCHNPFVDVLVDGKRYRNALQNFLGSGVKGKFLCWFHFQSSCVEIWHTLQ